MSQEVVHGQQNQILKKWSDVAKNCTRATKPNLKKVVRSSKKTVHEQQNQI